VRFSPAFERFESLELEDYLLLAAVLLLPWAFGGVEIWAYRSAALLVALAVGTALLKRGFPALGQARSRWLLPALLLAAWALVQVVPLPSFAIRVLSPVAHATYEAHFPGYPGSSSDEIVDALEEDALARVPEASGAAAPEPGAFRMEPAGRWSGWRTISVRPQATYERLLWYLALLGAFLLACDRVRDADRARHYRSAMLLTFVGLALFGLVQAASWNGKIFWVRAIGEGRAPFGPYANFVHFAGLMELAVPWLAGYAWMKFRHPEGETLWRSIAPIALGGAVLCVIAGLSAPSKASAGLMAATTTTVLVVGAASFLRSRGNLSWRTGMAVVALILIVWTGVGLLLVHTPLGDRVRTFIEQRGGSLIDEVDRVDAWKTGLRIVADYPVTGVGFGAFPEVFPRYMSKGEYSFWAQLHNDWLEVVVDGGVIAALLLLWLCYGFWSRALRRVRPARGHRVDMETLGLVLGVLSLTVHAVLDFNHQIPATALMFVTAGALTVAAGGRHGRQA
jgi:multisubunit Na+/H+ antiporter MnhB subunit